MDPRTAHKHIRVPDEIIELNWLKQNIDLCSAFETFVIFDWMVAVRWCNLLGFAVCVPFHWSQHNSDFLTMTQSVRQCLSGSISETREQRIQIGMHMRRYLKFTPFMWHIPKETNSFGNTSNTFINTHTRNIRKQAENRNSQKEPEKSNDFFPPDSSINSIRNGAYL